jgi:beta-lactamase class D
MKILTYLLFLIINLSCSNFKSKNESKPIKISKDNKTVSVSFQKLLDSNRVEGAIVVYNSADNKWISNDFKIAEQVFTVASTFKITNSIIGLESGVISEKSIFKWDNKKRNNPEWEKDLTLQQAFKQSCLPCYHELAREIGCARMSDYLKKYKFPELKIDSANLDKFWINGQLKLSPLQQIDFLNNVVKNKFKLKNSTLETIQNLMFIEKFNGINFYGKTGWAFENNTDLGWFIGYALHKNSFFYVAIIIQPKDDFDMKLFGKIRYEISRQALEMTIL